MADQEGSLTDETEVPRPHVGGTGSVSPAPAHGVEDEIHGIPAANKHDDDDVNRLLTWGNDAEITSTGTGYDLGSGMPDEERIPSTVASARSYNSHGNRDANDNIVRIVVNINNQIDDNHFEDAGNENSRPNSLSANACSLRRSRNFDEEAAEPISSRSAQSDDRIGQTGNSLVHFTNEVSRSEFDDISSSREFLVQPSPLSSSFNGSSGGLYASIQDTYDSHHHGTHSSGRGSVTSQVEEEIPEILEDASDADDAIAVIQDLRDLVENSQDDYIPPSPSALINIVPNHESNEGQSNYMTGTVIAISLETNSAPVDNLLNNAASPSNVISSATSQSLGSNLESNVLMTGSNRRIPDSEENYEIIPDRSLNTVISSITNANVTPLLLVSSSGDTPTTDDQYLSSEEMADRVPDSPHLDGFRTASRIYTSAQRFRRRLSEPNRVSAVPMGNQLTTGESFEMDVHPNLPNRRLTRSLSSAVSHISVHQAQYSDLARLHSASVSSVLLSEATTSRPSTSRLPPPYEEYFPEASTSPRSSISQAEGSFPTERTPSGGLNRRPSIQSRPDTAARRPRPSSSLNNRPQSTGVCRGRSARFSWPTVKWESIDVVHLPPTGPDCLPGCGYSGLPCYICSTKGFETADKLLEQETQHRSLANLQIWTILRNRNAQSPRMNPFQAPVHLPLGQGTLHPTSEGSPPIYSYLYPPATATDCMEKFRQRLGIPRVCTTQCIAITLTLYGFLIFYLVWISL